MEFLVIKYEKTVEGRTDETISVLNKEDTFKYIQRAVDEEIKITVHEIGRCLLDIS